MRVLMLSFVVIMALCAPVLAAEEETDKKEVVKKSTYLPMRSDKTLFEAEELIRAGNFAEVLDITDVIIASNMRNADAHAYAAQAWYQLGNLEKAKSSATNVLAIDKGHRGAYVLLGLIALKEKDATQASYYLQALKIVCGNTTCAEFKGLERAVRTTVIKEDD